MESNIGKKVIIRGDRSGVEFIAKVFAKALQCEEGGIEPCGKCHSCKQAESGNQPDIIFVTHEKPNSRAACITSRISPLSTISAVCTRLPTLMR